MKHPYSLIIVIKVNEDNMKYAVKFKPRNITDKITMLLQASF